jgi:hypothetical protein
MNIISNTIITKEDCKRERKHNAVKLPENIAQCDVPIYVNYYKECYDQKNKCYREYFKIEKHPHNIHNKLYVSSKSNKINILEKLEEIKKMLLIIEEEYEHYKKNNETQEVVKDDTQEVIKDDIQEVVKDDTQEVIKDDIQEVVKDDTQEVIKDDIQGVVKDDIQEVVKDDTQEVVKDDTQEVIKDDIQEVVKDDTQQVVNISQNKNFSIALPKYIAIRKHETEAHKYYLIYDKKSGTKRNTLKALCSNSTLLKTNLELFIKKIEEKFAT